MCTGSALKDPYLANCEPLSKLVSLLSNNHSFLWYVNYN
jgi:hypothetical protein